jgi:hypothetical protein
MKNVKTNLVLILLAALALAHHSCADEPDLTVDDISSQVENQVQSKSWSITLFMDSGKNETNHFQGYSFTFEKDGKLISENGVNRFEGSWQITDNNSNDDSPEDLELIIYFNLSNDFEELNEDWNFISNTDSKIELIHISGGNGGTDLLTFTAR